MPRRASACGGLDLPAGAGGHQPAVPGLAAGLLQRVPQERFRTVVLVLVKLLVGLYLVLHQYV